MKRQVAVLVILVAGAAASGFLAWKRWSNRDTATYRLPQVDRAQAETAFHKKVLPVLSEHCWDCHGDGMSKGDVALDRFTNVTAVLQDRKLWERVLHNVESGDMPPKKKPPLPANEKQVVTHWLDTTLFPVDPKRPDPGRVTLRRLNRAEYNNTIRDLVGVSFRPADDFPEDDVGYGFDNIGDVLTLPPLLLEKYLQAAEEIMDEAIVDGPRPPPTKVTEAAKFSGGIDNGPVRGLAANGELTTTINLSYPGRYRVTIKAHGDQAGPDPVKMGLRWDDHEVQTFEVKAKAREPETYTAEIDFPSAGRHTITASFLNDFYQERWVERPREGKPPKKEKVTEDRNFWLHQLTLTGPLGVELPLPESHRQIFAARRPGQTDEQAARSIVEEFTGRAWRRPVTEGEVDRLMKLYSESRTQGDKFESAVKHALTAVLVSPHFLFRGEIQRDPNNPTAIHRVSEYALASRLSYFLWSSMPDPELISLAAQGKLRRNLEEQVRRMLKDPKAQALTDNFAGQWLQLRTLGIIDPDRTKFPAFNDQLRRDLRTETETFFSHIVSEDRPIMDFLLGDFTFVNERLAEHYGLAGVSGEEFVRVSLSGTSRQGLLTQGSVLTLTSNPTRTSPVKRGKWVLDNLLATPPPPPPPNVPELEAGEKLMGTLRQRMEKHRENALCASCHARMDPIGFALEHFDAIGKWREKDGTETVEPAGELNTGEKFKDHRELNQVLASARRDDFLRCLTEKLLTYGLGRGLEYYDKVAVQKIVQDLKAGEGRFSSLVLGVVNSAPFQWRRGEGDPNQVAAN
ncbi:MAG TPA: DUF1592 domain-containing protein [Verrucomicrobiota bacterium]|nr:DUF1592 domain-containing protein [Verrucomicrobiota bacterium]